jgi:hypothetical protein
MKLFAAILASLLFSSCAYNVVEDIYFRNDRTCDVKIELDFAKSLDSKNKDIILKMITGAALGFVDVITGIDTLSKDRALNDEFVKMLDSAQKDLKPVNFEIAVDTLAFINKDSLIHGITKKDTLNQYTLEQETVFGSYIYYVAQHLIFKMNIDIPNKVMLYGFELKNLSWDTLDFYQKTIKNSAPDYDMAKSTMWDLDKGIPYWDGNSVERSNFNFALSDYKEGQELDEQTKEALKNSYYIIKYHFPAPIKKCTNSLYKIEKDAKTVEFRKSLYEMFTQNTDITAIINY